MKFPRHFITYLQIYVEIEFHNSILRITKHQIINTTEATHRFYNRLLNYL